MLSFRENIQYVSNTFGCRHPKNLTLNGFPRKSETFLNLHDFERYNKSMVEFDEIVAFVNSPFFENQDPLLRWLRFRGEIYVLFQNSLLT